MSSAFMQLLALFIVMFIGFIFGKAGLIKKDSNGKIGKFILSGTFPLLIISSMDREFEMSMLQNSIIIMVATLIIICIIIAVIETEVRLSKHPSPQRSARHYIMLFGNSSFMGMPVLSALYGLDGVFYAAVMNAVVNVFLFSYGIYILKRDEHPSVGKILLNPGFIATIVGFILFLTPISLPEIIADPISRVGGLTIPLACLLAGAVISQNKLKEVFMPISVWGTSLLRLVVYPLILFGVLSLIGVDKLILSILVILWGTPAPLTAGAFVGNYGGDDFFANKVVVVSNLLSLITMSIMIAVFS